MDVALITKSIRIIASTYVPSARTTKHITRLTKVAYSSLSDYYYFKTIKWRKFKSKPRLESLIAFKKADANSLRDNTSAKKKKQFNAWLNKTTILFVLGLMSSNDNNLIDPTKIANHFGSKWVKYSTDNNFSHFFLIQIKDSALFLITKQIYILLRDINHSS